MILFSREKRRNRDLACAVYAKIAAQARQPAFFRDLGVDDTINGRFEILVLNLFVVVNRLVRGIDSDEGFARLVIEAFVTDMDDSYRQIGISDLRVGKKIKTLYGLFGARIAHYDLALAPASKSGSGSTPPNGARLSALAARIAAQVPGAQDGTASAALGRYMAAAIDGLAAVPTGRVRAGDFSFPDPLASGDIPPGAATGAPVPGAGDDSRGR